MREHIFRLALTFIGLIVSHLIAYATGPTALSVVALISFSIGGVIGLFLMLTEGNNQ